MRRTIAIATFFLLSACSCAATPSSAITNCQDIQNLPNGDLLLFGEVHGSSEAPALVFQLACSISRSQEVAVGLEIPSNDQPLIDSYLTSDGSKANQAKLISSDFWQRSMDGRSSVAMLKLIENVRALRNKGFHVNVFAFDDQPGTNLERNVAIADGIRRFRASHQNSRIIALMGNLHAMNEPMQFDGKELVPSGSLLKDLHPISVFIAYPAGKIWACMPTCGIQPLEASRDATGAPGFKDGSPIGGYTYTYLLPSLTASPPAALDGQNG